MAADGSVIIEIDGDDSKFQSKLTKLGGAALKGVTAAIGAVGAALGAAAGAAVKFGSDYETSLAKVSTIADTGVKSLDTLSGEIIDLSNKTGESAAGLNEALYQAISAGADTAHATDLVAVAVKAAKGGFTDTETAVDGLTSALNAYGMQTTEAEGLANQFLVTQNKGKTTFGELASSIGTVAPTAKAAGVPINELLSSVASLTANGIGTSEAMTGMKAALSNIIKPTSDAAKMAQQLGIDFSTSALKSKGWSGFLAEIKEKTGGSTEQMAALFGSVEALNTVLTLTSDQGMALMDDTLAEMSANTTALDDAYGAMTNTLQAKTAILQENVRNLGIAVYEDLEGPLKDAAQTASGMVEQITRAFREGGLSAAVGAIGDVLAQAVTEIANAAPQMINAAVELIQAFLTGLQRNLPAIAAGAVGIVTSLAEGIIALLPQLAVIAVQLVAALASGLAEHSGELISAALDMISTLAQGLLDALPTLVDAIPEIIAGLVLGIVENLPKIIEVGFEIIAALVIGIIEAIPKLVMMVPKIIGAIVDGFTGHNWFGDGKGAAEQLSEGIQGGVPSVKSAGKTVLDAATGAVRTLPENLERKGGESMEKLSAALRNTKNKAASAAREAAQGVEDQFDGLPGKAASIGESIANGVAEGILKKKRNAENAAKNMADSVVRKAKGALQINSPSRVMRDQVGRAIPEGMEAGILQEMPQLERDVVGQMAGFTERLQRAVEGEALRVSARLAPSAAAGGPAPSAAGTFTINVYTDGGTSPAQARDVGREIGAEAAREFRRRGITV